VVVAIAAAVVSVIVGSQLSRSSSTSSVTTGKYASVTQATTPDGAPILGDPTAKITILEFADFSCPHCLEYHPTIEQIIDDFVVTGQGRVMFRRRDNKPPPALPSEQILICLLGWCDFTVIGQRETVDLSSRDIGISATR